MKDILSWRPFAWLTALLLSLTCGLTTTSCDDDNDDEGQTDFAAQTYGQHQGSMTATLVYPGETTEELLINQSKNYTVDINQYQLSFSGELNGTVTPKNSLNVYGDKGGWLFNAMGEFFGCTWDGRPGQFTFTLQGVEIAKYDGGYAPHQESTVELNLQLPLSEFLDDNWAEEDNSLLEDALSNYISHYPDINKQEYEFPLTSDTYDALKTWVDLTKMNKVLIVLSFNIKI